VVGLLSTTEEYFWGRMTGKDLSVLHALVLEAIPWLGFALIAPGVARWGVRHQLEWPPRARVIVAHLAGLAATLVLFAVLGTIVNHWYGFGAPDSFWIHLRNSCVYQLPFAVITYSATVGIGYVAEYTRRSRELAKLQAELTQAQLSALRMQLNPHFLFNTLHTIAVFVREHDERHAVEMIEQLGDVLRHVLRSSNELEAPLASEVSFLQKYLEIEQARFGDRLKVEFAIDDATTCAMIPQLIVQPLVENALRHGLAPRAAAGRLSVMAARHGDVLELVVRDDGLGLRAGWDDDEGLGLRNVRDRLARMYGPAGRLALVSPLAGGVVATITMPFRGERGD